MNSLPSFEQVRDDLGDKVLAAMYKSVEQTRFDLVKYREMLPEFAAEQSDRGLANWIHDRLWVHVTRELEDLNEVEIIETGPIRELYIGMNYRFRAKRHDEDSRVRSYPTQTYIDFQIQPETLQCLEEIKLTYGYEWIEDEHRIGSAVMALHNGNKLVWSKIIPGSPDAASVPILGTRGPGSAPGIEIQIGNDNKEKGAQEQ